MRGTSPCNSRDVSVKALNKLPTEQLFKLQGMQELDNPKEMSLTWIKHLYGLVDQLYEMELQMTGIKPKDAIGFKEVPPVNQENYPPEDTLPEDGLYHSWGGTLVKYTGGC